MNLMESTTTTNPKTNLPIKKMPRQHSPNPAKVLKLSDDIQIKTNSIIDECNKKTHGRKINISDLLAFYVSNRFNQKDIEEIQKLTLSAADKLAIKLEEHNKENGTALTIEEWMCQKLKLQ